jgi:excisionase family DNA binding protein
MRQMTTRRDIMREVAALGEVCTLDELAHILRVSRRTVERKMENGTIQGIKVGRLWRIYADEIKKYLQPRLTAKQETGMSVKKKTKPQAKKKPPRSRKMPPLLKSMAVVIDEARERFIREAVQLNDERIIGGLLYEAHHEGMGSSHGARVSAWSSLADIRGMRKRTLTVTSGELPTDCMSNEALAKAAEWERDTSKVPVITVKKTKA